MLYKQLTNWNLFSHPDKNNEKDAEDRFIEINKAYDVSTLLHFENDIYIF